MALLEAPTATGGTKQRGHSAGDPYRVLEERVADLEADGSRERAGAGVGLSTPTRKSFTVDFKFCQSLSRLTDEKKAFRQWDVKLSNSLDHARKGFGRILDGVGPHCVPEREKQTSIYV